MAGFFSVGAVQDKTAFTALGQDKYTQKNAIYCLGKETGRRGAGKAYAQFLIGTTPGLLLGLRPVSLLGLCAVSLLAHQGDMTAPA